MKIDEQKPAEGLFDKIGELFETMKQSDFVAGIEPKPEGLSFFIGYRGTDEKVIGSYVLGTDRTGKKQIEIQKGGFTLGYKL